MLGNILNNILDTTIKSAEIILKPVEVVVDVTNDVVSEIHKIVNGDNE